MALGFGSTFGTGAGDKCVSAYASDTATTTWHVWVYNRSLGSGGGTFGRMLDQNNGVVSLFDSHAATANTVTFQRGFSGGNNVWTFTCPTAATWASITVVYDSSSVSNDPVIFLNGSKLTDGAGLTQTGTATGTPLSAAAVVYIGNRVGDARNWDGMIAEVGIWNALLSDREAGSLAAGYSPRFIRPASLVEYLPLIRSNTSRKLAAPTVVGTTQPHCRIIGSQ